MALQKVTEVHVFTERYRGRGIYRKAQRGKELKDFVER